MLLKPLLALMLAFLPAAATPSRAVPTPERAVMLVVCASGLGTAFRLEDGRVFTAAHVAEAGGCAIGGVPITVLHADGALDLAELAPSEGPGLALRCAPFAADRRARAIGHIQGHRVSIPLIATPDRDAEGFREFVGVVEPGMSGGPVLDERGRVRGVAVRRWPARSRELVGTFACGDRA